MLCFLSNTTLKNKTNFESEMAQVIAIGQRHDKSDNTLYLSMFCPYSTKGQSTKTNLCVCMVKSLASLNGIPLLCSP